jgi:CubicO group peptidase (beta-lactamase class C family)
VGAGTSTATTPSLGHLLGELVRRISGKSLGTYLKDEVAGPSGSTSRSAFRSRTTPGLPDGAISPEEIEGRDTPLAKAIADPQSVTFKALYNPPDLILPGTANSRAWRAAEIPAANGHATARALARLYGALARGGELDGVRVLSRETIDRARIEESYGEDAVLVGLPSASASASCSTCLVQDSPRRQHLRPPGAGAPIGFADPEARAASAT